jgi:hypothetical protein
VTYTTIPLRRTTTMTSSLTVFETVFCGLGELEIWFKTTV